ncbi:hypothetical protein P3T27_007567 [Kitasatospora sp. MAA19]|uniref:hypothetical protein n=1 Tax=Kitasatospora sp. MAA19 TaxID=3035090 RepID=UPI002474FC56|nr:hypothetical protein [Kitasatospora sp. MAA19]MDH6710816.1 hypothetical protein [Kitasatospora sp. MAA19]
MSDDSSTVKKLNVQIAELVKEVRAEDLVQVLMGPEESLLRLADQQQQQQQQQVKRPAERATEIPS